MTNQYDEFLTQEEKIALVENRLKNFAAEAYQHELNRQVFELQGKEEDMKSAIASIETIESVITIHKDLLAKLK